MFISEDARFGNKLIFDGLFVLSTSEEISPLFKINAYYWGKL